MLLPIEGQGRPFLNDEKEPAGEASEDRIVSREGMARAMWCWGGSELGLSKD